MSRIKRELDTLKNKDVYSLILFALYKIRDIPEYSSLSELAYILDKDNMLKLCEYFGGLTIRIPTITELETVVYALVLYQYVDIEHINYDDALLMLGCRSDELHKVKPEYQKIRALLCNYDFTKR